MLKTQCTSPLEDSQDNNQKNDSENSEQTACLVASIFLMPTRCSQFLGCTLSIVPYSHDIMTDDVQLFALFTNHMRDVAEELVQLADTLFDLPDLAFPL